VALLAARVWLAWANLALQMVRLEVAWVDRAAVVLEARVVLRVVV